ncbi:MAG: hypothetical protein ACPGEG_09405 [Salibacteraceae bacterium]
MNAKSVERLKQKVEELITAFETQRAEINKLGEENSALNFKIEQLETKLNSTAADSRNTDLLKKKVDKLIKEVESCIDIANG